MNFFASKSERRSRSLQLENLENRELLDAAGLGTFNAPDYNPALVLGDDAERIAAPAAAPVAAAATANGTVKAELVTGNETSEVKVTWDKGSATATKGYIIQVNDSATGKTKSFSAKADVTEKTLKLTAGSSYNITVFAKGETNTKIGETQSVSVWALAVAPSLKKPTVTELKTLTANGFLSDTQIAVKVSNYTTDETHTLYKGEKFTHVDTLKVTVTQGKSEVAKDLTLKYTNGAWSTAISATNENLKVTFKNGFITVTGLEKSTSYKVSVLFSDTIDDNDGKATAKKVSAASAKTTKTVVRAPENVIVQPAVGNPNGLTVTWDKAKLSTGDEYSDFYNIVVYDSAGKKVAFSGDKKTNGTTATLTLKKPVAGETYTVTVTPIGSKETAKPVESNGVTGTTAIDKDTPIFGSPDLTSKPGSVVLTVLNKEVLPAESFTVSYSQDGKAATNVVLSTENDFSNGSVTYVDGKVTIALPTLYNVAEYTVKIGTGSIVFKTAAAEKDPWGKVKNVTASAEDGSYTGVPSSTALDVYVRWDAIRDENYRYATNYVVKVYQVGQDKPVQVTAVRSYASSPETELELTDLIPDTEYYVTVTAEGDDTHKAGTESAKSSNFGTALAAPKLTLGESTSNSVTVNVTGYDTATSFSVDWYSEDDGDYAYFTYSEVLKRWVPDDDRVTFADGKLTITGLCGNTEYEVLLRFDRQDAQTGKWNYFDQAAIMATTDTLATISVSQISSEKTSVKFKLNELVDNKTIAGNSIDRITISGDIYATFTRSGSIWTPSYSSYDVTFKDGVFEVTGLSSMNEEYAVTVTASDLVGGLTFGPAKATLSTKGSPIVITADTAKTTAASLTFNVAGYTEPAEGKTYPTFNGDEVSELYVSTQGGYRYLYYDTTDKDWQEGYGYGINVTYDGNAVTVSGLGSDTDYNVNFTFSGPTGVSWKQITVKATTAELAPLVVKEDTSKKGEDKLAFTVEGYKAPAKAGDYPTVNGVEVRDFYVFGHSANWEDEGDAYFYFDGSTDAWVPGSRDGFLAGATFDGSSLVIPSGLTAGTVYVFEYEGDDGFAFNVYYGDATYYAPTDTVRAKTSGTAPKGYDDYVQPTLTATADGAKANELAFTVGNLTGQTIAGVKVDSFTVNVAGNDSQFTYDAGDKEWKKAFGNAEFDGTNLVIKGLQEDTAYSVGGWFTVNAEDPAYGTVNSLYTNTAKVRTADVIDLVPSVSGVPTADGALFTVSNFDWATRKATGVDQVVNDITIRIYYSTYTYSTYTLTWNVTDQKWDGGNGVVSVDGTGAAAKLKLTGLGPENDYTISVKFGVWDTDKGVYTYEFGWQQVTFTTAKAAV